MAILDPYGKPVRSPRKSGNLWRRNFFHGASQDTKTPYAPVRIDDIDSLLPAYDWRTLLSGSRGMYANFGVVRSACFQKAENSVGNAYLPDFTGSDPDSLAWARDARSWLVDNWMRVSDVRGQPYSFTRNLWLDSVAVDRDGDVFYLLTTHRQSGLPAIQHIPATRCRTGPHDRDGEPIAKGRYRGAKICNGVIKNRQGRTIAFRIHTGEDESPKSFSDISARDCRQIYDPEWHEQSRGIPAGSHSIRFLMNSLQSHEWEHTALMMLSSIGLIERNVLGLPDEDDPANTLGESDNAPTGDPGLVQQTYEGGTIRYFSTSTPGAGLEAFNHDRPSEQWEAFQDRTVRMYAAAVWPYELLWKSDNVNGVTIRNIQERANRFVRDRQALLDPHAHAQVTYALSSAVALGLLDEPPDPQDLNRWTFRKPKNISIDPGRDTRAEIEAIEANHTTLRSVVESRGATIEEHFDTIIADEVLWREKRAAAGLDPVSAPPPPPETPDDNDDD